MTSPTRREGWGRGLRPLDPDIRQSGQEQQGREVAHESAVYREALEPLECGGGRGRKQAAEGATHAVTVEVVVIHQMNQGGRELRVGVGGEGIAKAVPTLPGSNARQR